MFEKEAEEYLKKLLKRLKIKEKDLAENQPEILSWEKMNFVSLDVSNVSKAFQKGAELGYQKGFDFGVKSNEKVNKANEWHYVKDEFPPENVPLNIITLDKNKKRRLWVGEYKGGNGEYWSGYFNHFIDVPYAWKEIVLPESEG